MDHDRHELRDRVRGSAGRRGWAVVLACACAVPVARPATAATRGPGSERAEESQEVARALELFAEGRAHFEAGEYAPAIEAFEGAYALYGEPNLLYNIALAYHKLGDFDLALVYLERYRARAPADEHESIDRRKEEIEREREQAEQRRREEEARTAPPEAPPPTDTGPPPRVYTTGPAVLTALGLAGLGAGVGLAVVTLDASDRARSHCMDTDLGTRPCRSEFEADARRSRTLATSANVAFAVGGAAALGAIVWLSVNGARRAKHARSARLDPHLSPTTAGLVLRGRF
jgi:tetratricopeptide (TPR) repeat protein